MLKWSRKRPPKKNRKIKWAKWELPRRKTSTLLLKADYYLTAIKNKLAYIKLVLEICLTSAQVE